MIVKHFKNKFTKLQSKTNGSKLVFAIAIANAFGVAFTTAWVLSYHSWMYLGTFEKLHPALFEVSIHFPNIYLMIICLTCLDKITHGMLIINNIGQRIVFHYIQKFDLWYWRKYNVQGPLSRGLFRAQENFQNLSVYRRRQVILVGAAIVSVWSLYRLEMI